MLTSGLGHGYPLVITSGSSMVKAVNLTKDGFVVRLKMLSLFVSKSGCPRFSAWHDLQTSIIPGEITFLILDIASFLH